MSQSEGRRLPLNLVLRELREAAGVRSQSGWATQLAATKSASDTHTAFYRSKVQRWETGETIPVEDEQRAIIELCSEKSLLGKTFSTGVFQGITVTQEFLIGFLHLIVPRHGGILVPE